MSATAPPLHSVAALPARWVPAFLPGRPHPWSPAWCQNRGPLFWLGANGAVLLGYLVLGCAVGRFFAAYGLFPAPIWLPAGLAAAAAMLGGWRLAPGIFLGSLVVNGQVFGSGWELASVVSLGNALGPLAGAALSRRFRPPPGLFTRFSGVVAFLAGLVLLHALVTASTGTLALWWLGGAQPGELPGLWSSWLLCDAGGTFYFTPSLAMWLGLERTPPPQHGGRSWLVLDGAVWLATAALAALVFSFRLPEGLPSAQMVFLLAVPLSWIALRISLRAAYTLLTLICVIASAGTVMGHGPFQAGGVANPMQSAGLLIVLCAMNILTLIALVSERREAEAALAEANRMLEWRVSARTEELRREAETDSLTGLANRRSFFRRAEAMLRRDRALAQPFCLLALDLDHFKAINDSAGHAAGDAVLRNTAACLAAQLRGQDLLGRIGGEEFAVALPGTDLAEGTRVAERLRAALAAVPLPPAVGRPRLSASLGIAVAGPRDHGLEELLRRADTALYAAKRGGRDRAHEAV